MIVMRGLDPRIHAFSPLHRRQKAVDTRNRCGHDDLWGRVALGTFFGSDAMKRIADELLNHIDKSTGIPQELKTHAYFKAISALGNLTTNLALGTMTAGMGLSLKAFEGVKAVSFAAAKVMAANLVRSGVSVNAALNTLAAGGKKANELRAKEETTPEQQLVAAATAAAINWTGARVTSQSVGVAAKAIRDHLGIPSDIPTQTLVDAFSAYAGGKVQTLGEEVIMPGEDQTEEF